ncbi:MAG: hypothetical protein AB1486_26000, partial [Planctomycetota bacterium]
PYRYSARDPGGHPFMGRLMLVAFLKLFATVLVAGFGALAGYAVWLLTGSLLLAALGCATGLALACIPLTYWTAAAFQGFDLSRDMPD